MTRFSTTAAAAPGPLERLRQTLDTPAGRLRPSRAGLGFLLAVLLSLVGCINYDLSLGYALTFLLAGVWMTSAAYAARQARDTQARLLAPAHGTAGGSAEYQLEVRRRGQGLPFRAELTGAGGSQALTVPAQAEVATFGWELPLLTRGLHDPAARLSLYDPLGLWRVTRELHPPQPLLVWPRPEAQPPALPQQALVSGTEGMQRVRGEQEFSGLRPYQPGDPTRRISWRRSAGREDLPGGGLLVRESDAPAALAAALDWNTLSGDAELRASRLAGWIAALSAAGQPFSLTLPGEQLATGQGEAHRQRALSALARVEPHLAPELDPYSQDLKAWRARLLPHAWPWTLLAAAWVLLPSLTRAPVWATLLTAALIGAAYWRTVLRPAPQRPSTVYLNGLALLAAAAIGGVYLQYGTLIGLDAGTTLLTLLLGLKIAESRSARDGVLVVLLGFFITLTHFLHSMSPAQALHALVSSVLLLGALHLWSLPDRSAGPAGGEAAASAAPAPGAPPAWKAGLSLSALSLPLMLALFFFFPRPAAPLWQFQTKGSAQTGLGSSVKAGDVTQLAQNTAVALRATFEGTVPPQEQLYWRGPVYEAYDGLEWNVVRANVPAPSVEVTGPAYRYSLLQEPNGQPWVLALDTVQQRPQGTLLTSALSVVAQPSGRAARFQLTSAASRVGLDEGRDRLNYDLQLPPGQNPRARALAQSWKSLPPEGRVQAALNYFASSGFSYTLTPPALPTQDRTDAFLFSARAGFCEHYASAFGFLMRAAGVPTRLVGGYQGGETAEGSPTVTVRQSSAHVWDEVWLEGRGWVRVDPTAAVAPARTRTDTATALSNPGATAPLRQTGLWKRLSSTYDRLQLNWYDLVVNFDDQQQASALSRLGLGETGGARYWAGFAGLMLLALLPLVWVWRARSRPSEPAARALDDLTRRLGLPRGVSEPVGTYVNRAAAEYPQLAPQLQAIAQLYSELRYGPQPSAADLAQLQQLVRRVRRP
ncbi:transglutaminaseTgpA domain-containing protein [Deinococcus sp. Marseille-Q6407]|uniref:transglutaminaseTgpA domain-containing protein n=1 Tax=Deinococcus sp. Marseille-Q6407 TaxID=2969223 RepID=UPI0021C23C4F|nr:transglutaminaseTgpA domain-containing protein [Deinococcus sp. Marseille-Q6407]